MRASFHLGLVLLILVALPGLAAAQNATNSVSSINVSGSTGEIELSSTQEFPVLDSLIELHVGNKTYSQSKSPAGGSLNKIIFFNIPVEELTAAAKNADSLWVAFRGKEASGPRWEFGTLDAAQLKARK